MWSFSSNLFNPLFERSFAVVVLCLVWTFISPTLIPSGKQCIIFESQTELFKSLWRHFHVVIFGRETFSVQILSDGFFGGESSFSFFFFRKKEKTQCHIIETSHLNSFTTKAVLLLVGGGGASLCCDIFNLIQVHIKIHLLDTLLYILTYNI